MKAKLQHIQNYRDVSILIYATNKEREFRVGNMTFKTITEAKGFIDEQYIPHFPEEQISLTELEQAVLTAFVNDDCVRDYGWQDKSAAAWVKDFHKTIPMDGKTFSGVMSSLTFKGVIWTNGDSFGLTDLGRQSISPKDDKPINFGDILGDLCKL